MPGPQTNTLTTHLLSHARNSPSTSKYITQATQHRFLLHAGQGVLPKPVLAAWLHQDIHYTRAYTRFIGGILARLPLGMNVYTETDAARRDLDDSASMESGPAEDRTAGMNLGFKVLDLLVFAMNNLQREMRFFEAVCVNYNLPLPDPSRPPAKTQFTRAYTDLLDAVGSKGSVLEALVLLWATEWCYLQAWRFARGEMEKSLATGDKAEIWEREHNKALKERFVPNWSSDEFEGFVERCGRLVNEVAGEEGLGGGGGVGDDGDGSKGGLKLMAACEELFEQVLWAEQGFWPEVEA